MALQMNRLFLMHSMMATSVARQGSPWSQSLRWGCQTVTDLLSPFPASAVQPGSQSHALPPRIQDARMVNHIASWLSLFANIPDLGQTPLLQLRAWNIKSPRPRKWIERNILEREKEEAGNWGIAKETATRGSQTIWMPRPLLVLKAPAAPQMGHSGCNFSRRSNGWRRHVMVC